MSAPFGDWDDAHIGRSWSDTRLEDQCPCPKEPCGLVAMKRAAPECTEHPLGRTKSIRQSHTPDRCPGRRGGVDGPECDHAPRTGGACLPCAAKYREAECDRLREELSQADAFGRGEFRVTTWAYEQAVRTMNEAKGEAEGLRARQAAVLGLCDQAERRAHDMVGIFSGKKGAQVPHWVGKVRALLGTDTEEAS